MNKSTVDQSRFLVSRLFVRTRKLAEAGYLSDEIVAKAFGGEATRMCFCGWSTHWTKCEPDEDAAGRTRSTTATCS